MNFVANFIRSPAVQKFENQLRFDKVTKSSKVGTFLRHSVVSEILRFLDFGVCSKFTSTLGKFWGTFP